MRPNLFTFLPELVLVVCLAKMIQEPNFVMAAALLVAMLGYVHKTHQETKKKIIEEEIQNHRHDFTRAIDGMKAQMKDMQTELDSFKAAQVQIEKSAEDIKRVISTKNLTNAVAPYTRTRT
jgi:hypothetical protein